MILRVRLGSDLEARLIAESDRTRTSPVEITRRLLDTHLPEGSTDGTDARRTDQPAP
jgi:hypothetical protein